MIMLSDWIKYYQLQNGLLDNGFVVRKVYTWFFVSKNVICVEYVDECIFFICSKFYIYKVLNYFKKMGQFIIWSTQMESQ